MPRKSGATTKLMAKKKGAMNRVAGSTSSTKESPIPPSKTTRKMARKTSTAGRELYLKKRKALFLQVKPQERWPEKLVRQAENCI